MLNPPALKENNLALRDNILLAYTKTQRAIRTDDNWKLILTNYQNKKHIQLFDLNKDPHELNNLYNDEKFQKKYTELNNELEEIYSID